jgi:glycosyltransferase involved in cell wall biosynthesis
MFSIVIPVYNEENTLKEYNYVNLLIKKLEENKFNDYEIILVNDGSTDKSESYIKAIKDHNNKIKVISFLVNKGYGSALKAGIISAKNDTVVITDVDGTYSPESLIEIIEIFNNSKKNNLSVGVDMVVAKRNGNNLNKNIIKFFLRLILKTIVQWSSGCKIDDINSGLRIFSRATIMPLFSNLSNFFSFTTTSTLAYLSSNYTIIYHPIEYQKRKGGDSHVKIVRDSLRTLQYVIEATIIYNPLKFFLFLSIIFLLISIIIFVFFMYYKISLIKILFVMFLFLCLLSFVLGFFSVLIKKLFK